MAKSTLRSIDHALDLSRRGLSVIPVPRPRPGVPVGRPGDGKVADLAWGQFQENPPTEDQIRSWFASEQNIAVITGRVSDVIVIDADSPSAVRWVMMNLPRTAWRTRTARGFHFWYGWPGVRVANRARVETRAGRLKLDVRGDHGYVIAPGSVHRTGAKYEFASDWSVAREQLPSFGPWLARPSRAAVVVLPPAYRPIGDVVERARRYLAAIPPPEIGRGSDQATLYAACRLTRGFGLPEVDATALLWDWAGGRSGWTPEWVARKVRNAVAYGTEPMGALR